MGTTWNKLLGFVELTKPRLLFLLFFTALVEALSLYSLQLETLGILLLSVLLCVAGTNVLACYLDRDIDGVMIRTSGRPLPAGRVEEKEALYFGASLLLIGVGLTFLLNVYVTFWAVVGSSLVLLYNWKLKRMTPWNIVLASPGGAAPVLGAYSAMTGDFISVESLLLALLIIFWTPVHIWSLAIFYSADYRRAGVPMLPVIEEKKLTGRLIAVFSFLYFADALLLFSMRGVGMGALIIFTLLSYPLLRLCLRLTRSYSPALKLFKMSNAHLALVLVIYFFSSLH